MIPVWEPVLDGNEERYVRDCLETNWISSLGAYITRFEEAFAAWCGMPHAVACSSGTAALHLSLVALGIGPGDEVIIPDFTLIVSANTVILAGAKPVLVDADEKTWCLDPRRIEEKITPRTKAIMAVHMYGHPCDMPAILDIARRRRLAVIEDCAEAHGAELSGRKVGTFGDAGCFSFYGNKILTTGEGGMVLVRDSALAGKLRLLRDQGFEPPRFVHKVMGFNYRLTNVQAAIGLAQTEKADEKVRKKREIASWYLSLFPPGSDVGLPQEAPGAKNVYWMFGVRLGPAFSRGRDAVMEELKAKGVETRAFFCPMHRQPVFRDGSDGRYPEVSGEYPVSDDLWNRGLYLPSGTGLTREQAGEVVAKLLSCAR
ncbi:MAG TPA: DegT/DnrJ/EryC1/StrS family aminotransferase [Thermoanaerobaculia bacterium]|nr:DegT/DnrJ/EryC1/StrS family aminotransferase [Thermoanaerobaculia bacterium]